MNDRDQQKNSDNLESSLGDWQGSTTSGMAGRLRTNDEVIDELFTFHAPTPEQVKSIQTLREAAKFFARTLLNNLPPCADQSAAIRKLRECVMTANAAIVLNGLNL